jgi:lipopolysaccharide export system protein LptC
MIEFSDTSPYQASQGREKLYRQAERHASRVVLLKRLLVSFCLLALVLFALYLFRPDQKFGDFDLLNIELSGDALTMSAPRLTGYDDNNNPYEVSARQATQTLAAPDIVELDEIEARITFDAQDWAQLQALKGVLDTKQRFLTLSGGLKLTSSQDYTLDTAKAEVNLADSHLVLPEAVTIDGPGGSLQAQTGWVNGNDRHLVFERDVKMVIYPQDQASEASRSEQTL